eukprot:jgi/Mesvir1/12022/Mv00319-RA.1
MGPLGVLSDAPVCFTQGFNNGTFDAGTEMDPSNDMGAQEVCAVCLDDKTDLGIDLGCNQREPYCGDVVAPWTPGTTPATQDLNDGDSGFGLFCGNCLDDSIGPTPDRGCTPDAPYCVHFGTANGEGHAGICSGANGISSTGMPIRISSIGPLFLSAAVVDAASVTIVPVSAACPKEFLVEASFTLALANCTTNEFNLKELMTDLMLQYFKTIPSCAIESSLLGLVDARRRHLLQTPEAYYLLLLRFYVESRAEGQSILNVLKSFAFGNFLVEALHVNVAGQSDLLDVQASLVQVGAAISDPHFTTPTGDKFDFNGVAGGSYCIITDKQVQVNARFVGVAAHEASTTSKPDPRTWMDQVAIMHGSDRILIGAASPAGTPGNCLTGNIGARTYVAIGG